MEKKQIDFAVSQLSEHGEIVGLGSVFNNVDLGGDIVDAKAFDSAIRRMGETGKMPKMLWQHDPSDPIGTWDDMQVTDKGLLCKGTIAVDDDLPTARKAYALAKRGIVAGLSIGFQIRDFEYQGDGRVRLIKDMDLWEVSLVTFPMNPEAGVTGIKSVDDVRKFEADLRGAGLSSTQAKTAVSVYKQCIERDADAEGQRDAAAQAAARDAGAGADRLRAIHKQLLSLTEAFQ